MTRAASDFEDGFMRGLDGYLTTPEPLPSVETPEDEEARERRWTDFIGECREFAATERDGYGAVLRAVAEAMKGQRELFRD
jgi:hypothetical protein